MQLIDFLLIDNYILDILQVRKNCSDYSNHFWEWLSSLPNRVFSELTYPWRCYLHSSPITKIVGVNFPEIEINMLIYVNWPNITKK